MRRRGQDPHRARHIDPERGGLTGEGAGQARDGHGFPARGDVEHLPAEAAVTPEGTYYGRPVIKPPVWIWSVPAYFYTGGVAAGAAAIGAAAQVVDRQGLDGLIRRCRQLAAAGTGVGTVLLVHDLGRPARFLNMLRVFRPTSAMSMGSWTLAAAGALATAAAALPLVGRRWARGAGDLAGLGAGALSGALGTYTAVLLSDTAVPVWQATRRSTPPLFAASAMSSAASLLDLLDLDARAHRVSRTAGTIAKAAEVLAARRVRADADAVERVGRPLHEGLAGTLWRVAEGATAASLTVAVLPVPARLRRARRTVSGLLGTAASLALRFALFHAGQASARDPRATFDRQRTSTGAQGG